jgi:hypothetical protein
MLDGRSDGDTIRSMAVLVTAFFVLPLFVGLAVVAVKTLEFVLNRDIATAGKVARAAMLWSIVSLAVGMTAWIVYIAVVISHDPS